MDFISTGKTESHAKVLPPRLTREASVVKDNSKNNMKYERIVPFTVNTEYVLIELLEYMENRQDVNDSETGPAPNKEMNLATDIRQLLYQLEKNNQL